MSQDQSSGEVQQKAGARSLTRVVISGAGWNIAATTVERAVAMGAQLILAWLLVPEQFGLVALATAVGNITQYINAFGIGSVLIQRQRRFKHWAKSAFYGSILLGIVSCLVVLLISEAVVLFSGNDALYWMIFFVAISLPMRSLCIVPNAALQIQMRFRSIALIVTCCSMLTQLITIALAYQGWGAFSFVLHKPFIGLLQFVLMYPAMRGYLSGVFRLQRWTILMRTGAPMFAANILMAFGMQGDYLILGSLCDATELGLYFLAFSLSTQAYTIFAMTLSKVAFPSLSALPNNERKTNATYRMIETLGMLLLPATPPLIVLAPLCLNVFFPERWAASGLLLSLLIPAAMMRGIATNGENLMRSVGRFHRLLIGRLVVFTLYSVVIAIGASMACGFGVAIAVLGFWLLATPLWLAYSFSTTTSASRGWEVLRTPMLFAICVSTPLTLVGYFTTLELVASVQLSVMATITFAAVAGAFVWYRRQSAVRRA